MKIIKILSLIMLIILASCQDNTSNNTPLNENINNSQSEIIATYEGGNITKSELNDYLLASSTNLQWNTQNTNQWITEIIQELSTKKQLLEEAKDSNIEDRILYKYEKHTLERYLYSQQYLSKFNEYFSNNNKDLLNYYNENIDDYKIEEERLVYHIFKSNDEDPSKTYQEITTLRQRVLNGENFQLLAEKYSDSESRHLKGLIGKIKKGVLTPDFDKVAFTLNLKETSKIIKAKDGYHIFFVDYILKAKNFEFSEVKNIIQQKLHSKTKMDYIKLKVEELVDLDKYTIPNSETELLNQLENNKSSFVTLKINDFILNVGKIKYSLTELKKAVPSTKVKEIVFSWVLDTAYREIIFQHMIENNIEYDQPALLKKQISELLVKEFSTTKILEYVNKHPELINDFYNKSSKRFASPIKFSFIKLTIPRTTNTNLMKELESSIKLLNSGELDLNSLALKYDGSITEIRLKSYNQLSEDDYHISSFASELELDQHSFPYTTRSDYHIVKLTERVEPKVQPLSLIRENLVKNYVELNGTEVFSKILLELSKSIKINEKNLELFLNDYKKLI